SRPARRPTEEARPRRSARPGGGRAAGAAGARLSGRVMKIMSRKTILVVDDEKPQRDILQEILTTAGYDVTSAASGEAALKFAKDRSFDLALTDLKMTGMDGIELLQHLLGLDSS